ncbi:large conductance mechanosensitive channel protein MscL [Dellaglioa algida]|uniref:Large-conductance mechanosensitive channel n=2 Tax=Dellaglioa algida TaxID=105612 RepID=A0A0R1HLZ1_9LACO|nr:large conductance mechanosensitive channel protein MscL [Dellaglioa algida]KRK45427.1 large conductance mechanosensitive channel [Dellaglioa algida DSM 15638]MDK1717556.1 large conductance mechanosensitive channel protein MscL [Dellaglioa algida]MDK1718929.1 large conductance mechanosensitive channel protein MscL [Dellaglioa algida]MDK1720804.1 large conductance mechanosensitive channel protein MscL [Dellaglioa algida]MDK1722473.1 large conductance mechanosensitive channel protein MscL [Del
MLKEFRDFITRGNVMDLAVAVIIGGAFTTIVKSFTTNIIGPIIALVVGKVDLSGIVLTIGDTTFKIGQFLDDIINFIIIAFVIFMLLKGITSLRNATSKSSEKDEDESLDVALTPTEEYLKDIRNLLAERDSDLPREASKKIEEKIAKED